MCPSIHFGIFLAFKLYAQSLIHDSGLRKPEKAMMVLLTCVTAFTCPVLTVVTGVPTAVSVITYWPWGMVIIWISDAENGNWRIKTFSQTQRPPWKMLSYLSSISVLKQWLLNSSSGTVKPCTTLQTSRDLVPANMSCRFGNSFIDNTSCSHLNHRITTQSFMDIRHSFIISSISSKFELVPTQHM